MEYVCKNLLFAAVFFVFSISYAYSACLYPDGVEGEIFYNKLHKIPQYCDGSKWIGMGWKGAPGSQAPSQSIVYEYIRGAENWSADPSVAGMSTVWNNTVKGLQFNGDKTWIGHEFLPINPGQKWFMTVTMQNVGSVPTKFYAGVASYSDNFTELRTDNMSSFNYLVASNQTIAPGALHTFSATMYGWNPVGGTGPGFDPKASYFKPIMLLNYQVPTGSIVVLGISVFPVP